MQARSLQNVSVWLDGGSVDESVFPHAMDWAFRLHLPLRAVVTAGRNQAPVVEKMKGWGSACAQRGVDLEMSLSLEGGEPAMEQFLRPYGLCVFVEDPSSQLQQELLMRSAHKPDNAVLMCAPISVPMTRIMVLCHQSSPNATYLENVARLCQALEIQPIILIVANTEREAHLRQGYAEGVCNSFGLLADCDLVVGCDLRSAVSRVANWRSCSHLIIDRQNAGSWWQRMNGDLLEQLRRRSDSLSILALPESVALDIPASIRRKQLSLAKNGSAGSKPESDKEYV
jgi:hypothetical protein